MTADEAAPLPEAGGARRAGWRLLPPGVLVAAVALLNLPMLWDRSMWFRDRILYMYPAKMYVRERLLAGELPLWTERAWLGRPFFGTIHAGVLHPGNLVLLALPPPLGIDAFYAAHLLVAGLGMRRWLRRSGAGDDAATLGGLLLTLSGHMVGMLSANGAYIVGVAWIPWALAEVSSIAGDDAPRVLLGRAARIGVFAALCPLGGDPQAAHTMGLLCLALCLARPGRPAVLRALATCAAGGALALLVAAVQLLPGLDVATLGRPGGLPYDEARHFSLHPTRLVELFWFEPFGDFMRGPWAGNGLYDEGTGLRLGSLLPSLYAGALVPWLALGALAQRRRLDVALAVAGLAGLLVALGDHTPVYRAFFHHVPGASWFRHPEKYWFVPTLCLTALAARGWPLALAAPRRAFALAAGACALLLAAAAVATFGGDALRAFLLPRLLDVPAPAAAANIAASARTGVLVTVLATALLGLAALGRLPARRLGFALAGLLVVDAFAAALPLMEWVPASVFREVSPVTLDLRVASRGEPVAPRLYRHPVVSEPVLGESVAAETRRTLSPNCGMEDGVIHLDAFEVFVTRRDEILRRALRPAPLRLLQVTATRFALLRDWELPGGAPPRGLTIVVRYPELAAALLEVAGVAPRVYLARRVLPAADAEEAGRRVAARDFVPGADAIVEGAADARGASGTCVVERFRPESIAVRCRADAPTYLVVSDAADPDWRATVDGREEPIRFANVAMRAVAVPAGDSLVEMTYRPTSLSRGAILSALGLALVAICLVVGRRRRVPAAT